MILMSSIVHTLYKYIFNRIKFGSTRRTPQTRTQPDYKPSHLGWLEHNQNPRTLTHTWNCGSCSGLTCWVRSKMPPLSKYRSSCSCCLALQIQSHACILWISLILLGFVSHWIYSSRCTYAITDTCVTCKYKEHLNGIISHSNHMAI